MVVSNAAMLQSLEKSLEDAIPCGTRPSIHLCIERLHKTPEARDEGTMLDNKGFVKVKCALIGVKVTLEVVGQDERNIIAAECPPGCRTLVCHSHSGWR